MLRSFLARLHPLILRLRRHDCPPVAQLGRRADQIISRSYTSSSEDETDSDADRPEAKPVVQLGRRADQIISRSYTSSSEDETDSDADRPEAQPVPPNCSGVTSLDHKRRRHLYVVLDDWKKGFSIHKLDLDDDGSDCRDLTLRPPAYRQAAECLLHWNFAAVGSKIVAAGEIKLQELSKENNGVTLLYDTETEGLSIVPRLPAALRVHWFLAAAARSGLYAFEDMSIKENTQYNVTMHHLEEGPSRTYWLGTSDHWSWKSIPSKPPFNTSGMGMMRSIAVHPEGGGRTMFVSVGSQTHHPDPNRGQTYSYDVESHEWRDHGEWGLPFHGHADYDMELDAWVGLHNGYERNSSLDGYICSCDVVSPIPNGSSSQAPPASKLCKERLFNPNTEECASLVYMGDNTYCMVEVVEQEKFKSNRCAGPGNKCTICLSMFRLKYDKNGELAITARQQDRSYTFSKYSDIFQVQAFWV